VLYRAQALPPPPGVKSDLEVMALVARALGRAEHVQAEPERAFEELARVTAGAKADYSGITYARIRAENGVFWPCPSADAPGLERPFEERFWTPDGRARFYAVEYQGPAESPDADYPLYLTTGRLMLHYQSGTQTRRVPALLEAEPLAFVEIHPDTAASLHVGDGETIAIVTRRGRAIFSARYSRHIRFDTLFVAFHYGDQGRANLLTNDVVDPVSKIPEFKVCSARIERLVTPA